MREQRQQAIRNILSSRSIGTQRELLAALEEAGQVADQSTLSRDLAELAVRKVGGRYELPSDEPPPTDAAFDFNAAVLSYAVCGPNLIVIRTQIGQAQPVALGIDGRAEPSIVATLAGDDTIFVATKTRKTQAVALRRLEAWFGDKRER